MAKKIDTTVRQAYKSGDSISVTIPKDWKSLIGMKNVKTDIIDFEMSVDLMKGRHGYFLAIYGKHQIK